MRNDMERLGQDIHNARKQRVILQADLAELAMVRRRVIGEMERGVYKGSSQRALDIITQEVAGRIQKRLFEGKVTILFVPLDNKKLIISKTGSNNCTLARANGTQKNPIRNPLKHFFVITRKHQPKLLLQ